MAQCKSCQIEFVPAKKLGTRQKFCSPKCNHRNWTKENYEKYRARVKAGYIRYKAANPNRCRICKEPIVNSKGGMQYCSKECHKVVKEKRRSKLATQQKLSQFDYYRDKESIGCYRCGYNKFGGALDFHHLEPQLKERRIDGKMWARRHRSDIVMRELEKCLLLCANCHREETHKDGVIKC